MDEDKIRMVCECAIEEHNAHNNRIAESQNAPHMRDYLKDYFGITAFQYRAREMGVITRSMPDWEIKELLSSMPFLEPYNPNKVFWRMKSAVDRP